MPNPSHTPKRDVRIADDLWEAATAKANRHGTDVSKVVREKLREYALPELVPGDLIELSGLQHGHDGVYVIEEGPSHGGVGADTVTLRRVDQ